MAPIFEVKAGWVICGTGQRQPAWQSGWRSGFLHCAMDDETVRRFGRNDGFCDGFGEMTVLGMGWGWGGLRAISRETGGVRGGSGRREDCWRGGGRLRCGRRRWVGQLEGMDEIQRG